MHDHQPYKPHKAPLRKGPNYLKKIMKILTMSLPKMINGRPLTANQGKFTIIKTIN